MPKKILLLIIAIALLLPVYTQVASVAVNAAPITSPVTNPITFFNLTGHITYKQLGRLTGTMQRFMPAENVLVKIFDFFGNSQVGSATTDANGNYAVTVPAGFYRVEASDTMNTFFVPPLRIVRLNTDSTKQADFEGLRFPSF